MPTHLPASWSSVVFLLCAFSAVLGRAADEDLSELEERAMRAAVARVAPSVVRIETIGGLERVESFLVGEGPTTGLVVAEDGYVISSAFNFIQQLFDLGVQVGFGGVQ